MFLPSILCLCACVLYRIRYTTLSFRKQLVIFRNIRITPYCHHPPPTTPGLFFFANFTSRPIRTLTTSSLRPFAASFLDRCSARAGYLLSPISLLSSIPSIESLSLSPLLASFAGVGCSTHSPSIFKHNQTTTNQPPPLHAHARYSPRRSPFDDELVSASTASALYFYCDSFAAAFSACYSHNAHATSFEFCFRRCWQRPRLQQTR